MLKFSFLVLLAVPMYSSAATNCLDLMTGAKAKSILDSLDPQISLAISNRNLEMLSKQQKPIAKKLIEFIHDFSGIRVFLGEFQMEFIVFLKEKYPELSESPVARKSYPNEQIPGTLRRSFVEFADSAAHNSGFRYVASIREVLDNSEFFMMIRDQFIWRDNFTAFSSASHGADTHLIMWIYLIRRLSKEFGKETALDFYSSLAGTPEGQAFWRHILDNMDSAKSISSPGIQFRVFSFYLPVQ